MLIRKFETKEAESVSNIIRETLQTTNSQDYPAEILERPGEYFSPEKVLLLCEERICPVAEINKKRRRQRRNSGRQIGMEKNLSL